MKTPKCVNCGEKMLETYTREGLLIFVCYHAQMTKLDISHGAMYCSRSNVSTHVEETKASFEYARNRYPKAIAQAVNVRALRAAFADLTKQTRLTYDQLSKAVDNTASEESILEYANIAIMLDLPLDQLPNLFGAAMKLGFATGIDTKAAIHALSIGVGRQSRMVLDNIGIMLKAENAYKTFPKLDRVTAWKRYALQLITQKANLLPQPDPKKVAKLQREADVHNMHTALGEQLLTVSK